MAICAAAASFVFVTCGEDTKTVGSGSDTDPEEDSGTPGLNSIEIEPGDITLVVEDGQVQEQEFIVRGKLEGGDVVDLSE